MRVIVVSALVVMTLAFAGMAYAGIPSAATSTVVAVGQGTACDPDAVICPASDMGSILVTVTVKNVYGDPLPSKSVTCYAIPVAPYVFCFCPGEDPQTGVTDGSGVVTFTYTDFGGCGDLQFGATCDGVVLNPSPAIWVASPDSDGDCVVSLSDFIAFASSYLTPDPCFDFDCSGLVDLSDFITFAGHYLHACP